KDNGFHTLRIEWDLNDGKTLARVFVDKQKRPVCELPLQNAIQHGISYVHFISARKPDSIGFDIESVCTKHKY
ncbi:MAG: exo-alpha-sialidase, partial [Bacteroidales bacterium]